MPVKNIQMGSIYGWYGCWTQLLIPKKWKDVCLLLFIFTFLQQFMVILFSQSKYINELVCLKYEISSYDYSCNL